MEEDTEGVRDMKEEILEEWEAGEFLVQKCEFGIGKKGCMYNRLQGKG
jgi:hypothetical protein